MQTISTCTIIRWVRIHLGGIKMSTLKETLDRLVRLPKFRAGRPASDDEISKLENDLHVRLPGQYVEFLRRFGWIRWFGNEVFGLSANSRGEDPAQSATSDG